MHIDLLNKMHHWPNGIVQAEILTVILIWRFGDHVKTAKLPYAIIDPFI